MSVEMMRSSDGQGHVTVTNLMVSYNCLDLIFCLCEEINGIWQQGLPKRNVGSLRPYKV